jgi:hypothetical protein
VAAQPRRCCRELADEQVTATANALFAWASARGRPHEQTARELAARWDLADFAERNAGPHHLAGPWPCAMPPVHERTAHRSPGLDLL